MAFSLIVVAGTAMGLYDRGPVGAVFGVLLGVICAVIATQITLRRGTSPSRTIRHPLVWTGALLSVLLVHVLFRPPTAREVYFRAFDRWPTTDARDMRTYSANWERDPSHLLLFRADRPALDALLADWSADEQRAGFSQIQYSPLAQRVPPELFPPNTPATETYRRVKPGECGIHVFVDRGTGRAWVLVSEI